MTIDNCGNWHQFLQVCETDYSRDLSLFLEMFYSTHSLSPFLWKLSKYLKEESYKVEIVGSAVETLLLFSPGLHNWPYDKMQLRSLL